MASKLSLFSPYDKNISILIQAIKSSIDGMAILDKDNRYIFLNKAHAEIYGYSSPSDLIGKTWHILYTKPELNRFKKEIIPILVEKGCWRGRATGLKKNGEIFDQDLSLTLLDSGGLICVVRDITEIVNTEKELLDSKNRYKSLFKKNYSIMLIIDPKTGNIVDANEAACKFYGWTHVELTSMKIQQINTLSSSEVNKEMQRAKTEKRKHFIFKHRISSGEIKDVEVYSGPIVFSGKKYLYSIIHDISYRIKVEEELHLNEEKMRLLVEGTRELFFYTQDSDAKVTYISPSVELITGYKVKDWIGQSHWFVTDSEINKLAKQRTGKHLKGIKTKGPIIVEVRHANGNPILLEVFESPIIKQGKVTGVHGVAHDITKRVNAEKQIQKDLKIKETLLKEIHHRVKNNLSIIISLLNMQSEKIKTKKDAIDAFRKSRDRVYSMALIHEKLYNSEDLSGIDMKSYIENIAGELLRTYSYDIKIQMNLDLENIFLDIDKAVPCGLIINELITNEIKHSFVNLDSGLINIILKRSENNENILIIKDNGIGLPEGFDILKQKSLGLRLINILTNQIDGKLEYSNNDGAVFKISFPE